MRKPALFATLLILLTSLSACSTLRFPGVYRLTIQQGNIITQEMVDKLEPGMTKRQVNFVLGTPLVKDTFNSDRWDYVYTVKDGEGSEGKVKMTVYFKDDKLTHFTGDFKPSEATTANS